MPGFQVLPGDVPSFSLPTCCSVWRRIEPQNVVPVLMVYTTDGFSLIDGSRLPKTLSPSSSQTMRLLYKSQFFLSLIIFICALGLQGKVASSFRTFLCYRHNSCSVLNANEILKNDISCSEDFFKKKKYISRRTLHKAGLFSSEGDSSGSVRTAGCAERSAVVGPQAEQRSQRRFRQKPRPCAALPAPQHRREMVPQWDDRICLSVFVPTLSPRSEKASLTT